MTFEWTSPTQSADLIAQDVPAAPSAGGVKTQRYEDEIAAIEDDLLGEIGRIQHSAAMRERALLTERDFYRAQLAAVTGSKSWRASATFRRARERGVPGAFWLLGHLILYVARVSYHLSAPYQMRRNLWYLRHTGRTYSNYYRALGSSHVDARAPADVGTQAGGQTQHTDVDRIQKAVGPDIICFPSLDWNTSSASLRSLPLTFADNGHRCYWLNPRLLPPVPITAITDIASIDDVGEREALTHVVSPGVEEVSLPGDGGNVTDKSMFRKSVLRRTLVALRMFCSQRDLREVVCLVQDPAWAPLVEELQRIYGWKVIYGVIAEERFSTSRPGAGTSPSTTDQTFVAQREEQRRQIIATSDLVAAYEATGYERLLALNDKVMLLPDGDQYPTLLDAIRRLYGRATIVIVSYRNLDALRLTITSVLEKTRYPQYEILIVDNGGQPAIHDYVRALAQRFPDTVRFVFNSENLGFAGGNNVGLRAARDSAYLVLLNDDVIVTPGWLGTLLRYLGDQRIGLVGPVTNSCGNEARIPVDYSDPTQADAFARRYTFDHDGVSFDIAVLAMYCIAMRQDVVVEIGELDERFGFGMFEDDDYAVRVHNAGYRVVCAEDVYVHHFGSASFGKLGEDAYMRLFNANRALFEEKWKTTWQSHKYREGYQS